MPDTPKPTVGVRQLRHDTAAILARVRRGEVLDITMRGKPIARLLPLEPPTKSSVLDELIASPGLPIGVRDVATRDLESTAWALQPPVRVDLLLDLRERWNWNLVRVLREITMRAMKRTVTRAQGESAMRQVPAGNLVIGSEFERQ